MSVFRVSSLRSVVLPKRFCASKRASSGDIPAAALSAARISRCARSSSSRSWSKRSLFNMPLKRAIQGIGRLPFGLLGEPENVGDSLRELLPVLFFFGKLFPAFGSQTIVAGAAIVL